MRQWKIPDDILKPVASAMQRELGKTCDNFITYDFERIRQQCGVEYAGVPLDDVRTQCVNLRKRGVLGAVNGHAPSRSDPPSDELLAYYESDHWKAVSKACREFWNLRCAVCNANERLDVHHRTYERLGCERPTDVIAVCRKCHKVCDQRRKRQAGRGDNVFEFADIDEVKGG